MIFGVYPGGTLGGDPVMVSGRPNNPERIKEAIDKLQGAIRSFAVRCYLHYTDSSPDPRSERSQPESFLQYGGDGRELDLVLSYTSESGNVAGWVEFVRGVVRHYGARIAMLQVT